MIPSALFLLVVICGLLALGLWVGLALLVGASAVIVVYTQIPLGPLLTQYSLNILTTPDLIALPLFIIMGEFLFRTNLSRQLFSGLAPWTALLPGRLLHVNTVACAIFASISGSSAATTQVVGRMSLAELLRRGYRRDIALGSLAGAGTLGFLIPPSTIMIIYGVLAQESVLRLFAAGLLPGLLLAALYVAYVMIRAILAPEIVPEAERLEAHLPLRERLRASRSLGPVLALIALTLGSMYLGIATPSEAAAIGVVGAMIIAWIDGGLTPAVLWQVAQGAASTCAMIGLIMMGATVLSITTTILGYPAMINGYVSAMDLSPMTLIAVMLLVYLALGCFMDGFSMIVTTLPVFLPLAVSAGFDQLWFGVFIIIAVEMSQITPPVGFNLFIINNLTGDRIGHIARDTLPFLLLMALAVMLLVWVPGLATWLPSVLIG